MAETATATGNTIRELGQTHFKVRSEEHTSELQSLRHLVCRLLLEKKKKKKDNQKKIIKINNRKQKAQRLAEMKQSTRSTEHETTQLRQRTTRDIGRV